MLPDPISAAVESILAWLAQQLLTIAFRLFACANADALDDLDEPAPMGEPLPRTGEMAVILDADEQEMLATWAQVVP